MLSQFSVPVCPQHWQGHNPWCPALIQKHKPIHTAALLVILWRWAIHPNSTHCPVGEIEVQHGTFCVGFFVRQCLSPTSRSERTIIEQKKIVTPLGQGSWCTAGPFNHGYVIQLYSKVPLFRRKANTAQRVQWGRTLVWYRRTYFFMNQGRCTLFCTIFS